MSWPSALSTILAQLVTPDWLNLSVGEISVQQWADQRLTATLPTLDGAELLTTVPTETRFSVDWSPVSVPCLEVPLLQRLTSVRRHLLQETGIPLQPLGLIVNNETLQAGHYRLRLGCRALSRPTPVYPGRFLAIGPEDKLHQLPGSIEPDPTYGMPGKWIPDAQRTRAERLGCMLFDPISVISTHLVEAIRSHAGELIAQSWVQDRLDHLATTRPHLVHLVRRQFDLATLTQLFGDLVVERESIRDLSRILHLALAHPQSPLAHVRQGLAAQIVANYTNRQNSLNAIILDPQLQARLSHPTPRLLSWLQAHIEQARLAMCERGLQPIILCDTHIRQPLRAWLSRSQPATVVLAWQELPDSILVNRIATITGPGEDSQG